MSTESKICVSCGLEFFWRKKWERNWDTVKYCSERCKKSFKRIMHVKNITAELVSKRETSLCPSEVAKVISPDNWKERMQDVHSAARLLAHENKLCITQKGGIVDPQSVKGPRRLRRVLR